MASYASDLALSKLKRKYPRVDLEFELLIQADGEDYWVNSVNLSFGGILVETDAPLEGGMEVSLTLNHLDLYGTSAARVMWTSSDGYGLKFVNPSSDFVNALVEMITPMLPPDWDLD